MNQQRLKELLHYDPDTGILTNRVNRGPRARAGDEAGNLHPKGYRAVTINYKVYQAHRLAYLYMTGEFPPAETDHINGATDDNRWCNLRAVTSAENTRNRKKRKDNTSGITGVRWYKRISKYTVQISHSGKQQHIGIFDNFLDACCARKSAELIHGYHHNHGRA